MYSPFPHMNNPKRNAQGKTYVCVCVYLPITRTTQVPLLSWAYYYSSVAVSVENLMKVQRKSSSTFHIGLEHNLL